MRLFVQQRAFRTVNNALEEARRAQFRSLQRLTTGRRINAAADDAAGLAIGTSLEAMRRSLTQAHRNSLDALSLLDVAESGVQTLVSLANKTRVLAVQSASGQFSDKDRSLIAREYANLLGEMDRITKSSQFNGIAILDPAAVNKSQLSFMIDGVSGISSELSFALRSVALSVIGRTDEDSGVGIVSSNALQDITLESSAASEPVLEFKPGPYVLGDEAELIGTNQGPFVSSGVARMEGGSGPFEFTNRVAIFGQRRGPFEVPEADQLLSRERPGYDIVEGENDTLTLSVDGVEKTVQFRTGFWTSAQIAQSINSVLGPIALGNGNQFALQAGRGVSSVKVVGGSAVSTFGLTRGSVSEAMGSLIIETQDGEKTINFPSGTLSTEDVVQRINAEIPGLARDNNGLINLEQNQSGAFVRIGNGSANEIFGFNNGSFSVSSDEFSFKVGTRARQTIQFGNGTFSAEEVASMINARSPGLAKIEEGRLVLEASGVDARIQLGGGHAYGVLGLTSGGSASGENYLALNVNGTRKTMVLNPGTYTAEELAEQINTLFPELADVVDGRIRMKTSGAGAFVATRDSTINEMIGLSPGAVDSATNILQVSIGGELRAIPLLGGTLSPQEVADAINAQIPNLATVEVDRVVLNQRDPDAALSIGRGTANAGLGLVNDQATRPVEDNQSFIFWLNGERKEVEFEPGSYTSSEVAQEINSVQPGFARLLSDGRLRIGPQSVGNTHTVLIGDGGLNAKLGFSAGQVVTGLDTDSMALTEVDTQNSARVALEKIDQGIQDLSRYMAELGALRNHVTRASETALSRSVVHEAARQRIVDADFARETAKLTRAQILVGVAESLQSRARILSRSISELYGLLDL